MFALFKLHNRKNWTVISSVEDGGDLDCCCISPTNRERSGKKVKNPIHMIINHILQTEGMDFTVKFNMIIPSLVRVHNVQVVSAKYAGEMFPGPADRD